MGGRTKTAFLKVCSEEIFKIRFEAVRVCHWTTIQEIQQAFETQIEAQVAPSTIYRLLKQE